MRHVLHVDVSPVTGSVRLLFSQTQVLLAAQHSTQAHGRNVRITGSGVHDETAKQLLVHGCGAISSECVHHHQPGHAVVSL